MLRAGEIFWRTAAAGAEIFCQNTNPRARGSGSDGCSDALAKEAVVVAVPVEPAMAAAATKKTGFGVSFGIELNALKAAAGAVGDEGNVVLLGHGVINGDVILVLDMLDAGGVGAVSYTHLTLPTIA